jgi:hypothetical protein
MPRSIKLYSKIILEQNYPYRKWWYREGFKRISHKSIVKKLLQEH